MIVRFYLGVDQVIIPLSLSLLCIISPSNMWISALKGGMTKVSWGWHFVRRRSGVLIAIKAWNLLLDSGFAASTTHSSYNDQLLVGMCFILYIQCWGDSRSLAQTSTHCYVVRCDMQVICSSMAYWLVFVLMSSLIQIPFSSPSSLYQLSCIQEGDPVQISQVKGILF